MRSGLIIAYLGTTNYPIEKPQPAFLSRKRQKRSTMMKLSAAASPEVPETYSPSKAPNIISKAGKEGCTMMKRSALASTGNARKLFLKQSPEDQTLHDELVASQPDTPSAHIPHPNELTLVLATCLALPLLAFAARLADDILSSSTGAK